MCKCEKKKMISLLSRKRSDNWFLEECQTRQVTVSAFTTNQCASALQNRDVTSENLSSPIRHVHNRTPLDRGL